MSPEDATPADRSQPEFNFVEEAGESSPAGRKPRKPRAKPAAASTNADPATEPASGNSTDATGTKATAAPVVAEAGQSYPSDLNVETATASTHPSSNKAPEPATAAADTTSAGLATASPEIPPRAEADDHSGTAPATAGAVGSSEPPAPKTAAVGVPAAVDMATPYLAQAPDNATPAPATGGHTPDPATHAAAATSETPATGGLFDDDAHAREQNSPADAAAVAAAQAQDEDDAVTERGTTANT
jgi:hypothetical protein